MPHRIVGKRTPRLEGPDKVRGRSRYAADMTLPGMLWGKVLRSTSPHATILNIDTRAAENLPGVHAVLTGAAAPIRIGRIVQDLPVLAIDKVRFIGERVAAVAAESADIAEQALALIEVEYAELPAVFEAREALREGAPVIHEKARDYPGAFTHPEHPANRPNLLAYGHWINGDADTAFAEAEHVFEHSFRTPLEHHGYIEPHACLVSITAAGVDIWASNKSPYLLRLQLARAMQIDPAGIRVHPIHIGGDFGGKGNPMDVPVAYLLSRQTGRPVKMVMSYTEELMAANGRHPGEMTISTAVRASGEITGLRFRGRFNSGAYGAFKPVPTLNVHGVEQAASCYRIPAVDIASEVVYTNCMPAGHMRSPGAPQVNFAVEAHFNLVAKELGLDPAEFRMKNLLRPGDPTPLGVRWNHIKARETLQAALDAVNWKNRPQQPWTGYGMAVYERPTIGGDCSCKLVVEKADQVRIFVPVPDAGQGTRTAMLQMAAERLCIDSAHLRIEQGSMQQVPFDIGVSGGRTTHAVGKTVMEAVDKLRGRMIEEAATRWNVPPLDTTWQGSALTCGKHAADWQVLLGWILDREGKALEIDVYNQHPMYPESMETHFTAQIAKVRVDPETGQVTVEKLISAHDISTIINPMGHQGQIEGGAIFGFGGAVMEEHRLEDGLPVALHLGDYKVPCMPDIPQLETVLVHRKEGPGPFNLSPISEAANVPAASAIVNAVQDAIGKPVLQLPVTAERIHRLLRDQSAPAECTGD